MVPFIGRQRELRQLQGLLDRNFANLVVIKGRRRIGKSRLVAEFAKNYFFIPFSGLPPTRGVTARHQRLEFAKVMAKNFKMPEPSALDWSDLFWHLADQTKTGRVIILLDEISWLAAKDPTFWVN